MTADWHAFLRIYDCCIRFGVLHDGDLDYVTKAARILQPESLAVLLLRRMEARMHELAKYGEQPDA
jgi:hypothetical protein